ncbi:MAG: pilus assembly protein PilM, partial [Gemmatimonadota bacterium]|nr:pilus assembly protein PilM [Gemmatimonadota bacterium]
EIMDPQLVVETIRSIFQSAGIKPKNVVISVGGRDVMVKKIQMDRMKESDAREVIRWEAEQYVPFDMENVQLDFQILDPLEDGLQMNVLLVAAKRDLVDQKVSLLRDAGISPSIVDVDAFALFNAFEYNYPEAREGILALVNVGHEVSTVNVLQWGVPVLTRDIPFGSRRLREDLRRLHGLSPEDAEAVLQGHSERGAEFRDLLAEGCEELAIGIERAVAFLSMTDTRGEALARVFLCGGGARIPGLPEVVGGRLRARTEIASPLQRLRVRPGVTTFFPVEELAPMLMLPIGLALRSAA